MRILKFCAAAASLLLLSGWTLAQANATPFCPLGSGASVEQPYRAFCVPANWDASKGAFYYAHGTTSGTTLDEIADQLTPGGVRLQDLILAQGLIFAVCVRSDTGLSEIDLAVQELEECKEWVETELGQIPSLNYVGGVSQGAGIVAIALERKPELFNGAIGVCGPIGDFKKVQLFRSLDNYNLLDHYLRNAVLSRMPSECRDPSGRLLRRIPDPVSPLRNRIPHIPEEVVSCAEQDELESAIKDLFITPTFRERRNIGRFLRVTGLASEEFYNREKQLVADEIADTMEEVVVNFTDAVSTLGGHIYNNKKKIYLGSGQDFWLNLFIQRFNPAELANVDAYETSGELIAPFVTPHNIKDPRVPFAHELLYEFKTIARGAGFLHTTIPLPRYGHCNITQTEALLSFALLRFQVEGFSAIEPLLLDPQVNQLFEQFLGNIR